MAIVHSVENLGWEVAPTDLTVANLGSAATYSSSTFSNKSGGYIRGFVSSDQSGTLTYQTSVDNVNWKTLGSSVSVTGGTPASFSFTVSGPLNRIHYVNGATITTTFILATSIYPA